MSHLRGEIYHVKFDPSEGSEMKKSRPALIVSDNVINKAASIVIVCPITNARDKTSAIHIFIPKGEGGLTKDSVAHCGQLRAIDKNRLGTKYGSLSAKRMSEIDIGLRFALAL